MDKKEKALFIKENIRKFIFVSLSVVILLIAVVIIRKNIQKEDIQVLMRDLFSEGNLNITDDIIQYKDFRADFNNEGSFMLDYIKYNEKMYNYYYSIVPEEIVDTSQCLMQIARYDDNTKIANIYKMKESDVENMLVAEMEGIYYQYKSRCTGEPNDIKEYINIIGTKDKLDVEYIEVTVLEDVDVKVQYIYGPETEEWVWDLLLNGSHDFKGWIPCECTAGGDMDYPKHHVKIDIIIRNNTVNMVYKAYILPNGNVGICEGIVDGRESEYQFSASEIMDALEMLTDIYEAYKVK